MTSEVDVSSITCEKILQSKLFFPRILTLMARDLTSENHDKELPSLDDSETTKCTMIMEDCGEDRLFSRANTLTNDGYDSAAKTPSYYGYESTPERSGASSSTSDLFVNEDNNSVCSEDAEELQKLNVDAIPTQMNQDETSVGILPDIEQSTPSCSTSESPVLPDILLVGSQQSLDDPAKPLPEKVESTDSGFCSKSDSPTPISSQTSSQQTSDTSTAAHPDPEIEKEQTTPQTTTPNGEITKNCKQKHFHGGTKDDGENEKVEGLRERLSKWRSLPQLNKGEETECSGHARIESVTVNESHKQRSRSDGSPGSIRVRRLSEKGKMEQKFPVLDPRMKDIWDFNNFAPVKNLKCADGIWNSSQHCFMIAVMQTLTHTAPFVRFVVDKHNHNHGSPLGKCFCCDLKKHIFRVLNYHGAPHKMGWILTHWRRLFGEDYHGTQEDAHEFLIKVLDQIDRCSCSSSSPKAAIPKGPSPPMMQLFGFKLRYQLVCPKCGNSSVNYALHNDLSLHLPKQGGFSPKMHNLIALYMKEEVLDYSCPNKRCGAKHAKRKPYILRAPSVLVLQIKRFLPNGKKNGMKVQVEEHLSLREFAYSQSEIDDYELTAIISHEGYAQYSGHYTALVRGYDRQFYYFNDEYVKPQKLLTANFLCPYVVVYSRKGPQERVIASPSRPKPNPAPAFMASLPGPSTVPSFNQNLKANGFATGMNKILPVLPVLPVLPQRKFEFKMGTSSDSRGSASQINFSFKGGGNVASGSHQNGIDREISKENGFGPPTQIQSRSVLPAKSLFSQNGNTAQSNRFSFKLNPPGNLPRVNFGFPPSSSHQSSNQIKAREHPKSNGYFSVSYDDPAMKKPRLQ